MRKRGITLITVVVMIVILLIIASIAVVGRGKILQYSQESVLEDELATVRSRINQLHIQYSTETSMSPANTTFYGIPVNQVLKKNYPALTQWYLLQREDLEKMGINYCTENYAVNYQKNEAYFWSDFYSMYVDKLEDPTILYQWQGDYTFNGSNQYINTGVSLFYGENAHKNFEIAFDLVSIGNNANKQDTMLNVKAEGIEGTPGFVLRTLMNNPKGYEFSCRPPAMAMNYRFQEGPIHFSILRLNDVLYYSYNREPYQKLGDYSSIYFDVPVTFGASINKDGNPFRFFNGTLSDMMIRVDEYLQESDFGIVIEPEVELTTVFEQEEAITFDGTNILETGISLFSEENYQKDFQVSFIIESFEKNASQATFVNSKNEDDTTYPGFVLRTSGTNKMQLSIGGANSGLKSRTDNLTEGIHITIARKNKKLYFTKENETPIEVYDFTNFTSQRFNNQVTFGALYKAGKMDRTFKGTISHISIQLEE